MGMQINTNLGANNAFRNLNNTQNDLSKSLEKLSSGLRINRAADDAAGMSIATALGSQVSGLDQAGRNTQDGISVIQTADGALGQVTSILQRMRDLAVQGNNGANSADAISAINGEAKSLGQELQRITDNTKFGDKALLDGSAATMVIQVGANGNADDQITINLADMPTDLGTLAGANNNAAGAFDLTSAANAQGTITTIDAALKAVSASRSDLGATQNRLESASKTVAIAKENLSAAQSRIQDTDMASEMVKYTKAGILSQAGTAMLAQANQSGQGVLQLLR
ncbi:flagellin [Arthrobacter sp. ok362]|uniref:flagellin N-terminal helical domain-containing protein n=1 Tax=Arthrobacter sp. ok362 TaxID=1761745 RepID=UPI000884B67E|nr:flagellin [Arthrobacter sp. ok362]SDL94172.1 flagellin [Arthrobacter sp. ok362]